MHCVTETGRLLHEEHHRVVELLNRLDAFMEGASDRVPPDFRDGEARGVAEDLHRFLDGELEPHFDFEEQAVFPVLAEAGAHELTAHLAEEHAAIRPLARRVRALSRLALAGTLEPEEWPVFRAFSQDLAGALFLHVQQEETTLLMAVDAVMGERDTGIAASLDPA